MNKINHKNNQRDFYRCDIEIPFSFSIINGKEIIGPYSATTINLSGGGMFFMTSCPMLKSGTLILAEFKTIGKEKSSSKAILAGDFMGRVIRDNFQNKSSQNSIKRYQLAVEFQFLHKATKNDIVAYINQHETYLRCQNII